MSHTTTIGNFSVQSVEFSVPEGDTITSVNPTATLTLVPDTGYQINANDFSYTSGPSQITNVVFTQSGDNVLCVVTFDTTYVMPGNDIDLPICIEGSATLLDYTLDGIIKLITSGNTTPSSGNTNFSASGYDGEVVQAFSYTLSANSGYYFDVAPTGSITTGDPGNYSIITSETFDAEGNLTAMTFTADYTFPAANVSGNVFSIIANAKQIPVPVYEITSYTINTSNLPGETNTTRNMKIFGTPGAQFSLTVVNEDGTSILSSVLSNVVIPASGVYSFNILFPSVSDNDQYDFVLTGDGVVDNFDGAGQQPSTFTIYQYLQIDTVYSVTSTNTNLTLPSSVSYTYEPDITLSPTDSNYAVQFDLVVTSGATITVNAAPLPADFTNTDPLTNGGTNITINSVTGVLSNNDTVYTITVDAIVSQTGTADVFSNLDLDGILLTNRPPTANNVVKTIVEDESTPSNLVVQLLGADLDNDPLTYTILTLPLNGNIYDLSDTSFSTPLTTGAVTGSSFLYKPDANWNGVENFSYKVNDGVVDSNNAGITITVTPVNDAPIITSTAPQYTGVAGGTYTYNFTYNDVDNTDAEVAITTQSSLPSGWTLTDNQDGTGTLTGPVPAGLTTIVLIATDPGGLTDSETISISAAYDILTKMEFLVSYRSNSISSSTAAGQSPLTTSAINLSAKPTSVSGHTCNNADFILLAETQDNLNNTVRFVIGKAHLGNTGTSQASATDYNLLSLSWNSVTLPISPVDNSTIADNYAINSTEIDTSAKVFDHNNSTTGTYSSSDPTSYYVSGTVSSNDRASYLTISPTLASQMAAATNTGVFTLRLAPDSWRYYQSTEPRYRAFTHASAAWLQVFKENSAGTNQEEVLDSNGNSFGVTTASNIAIDIFTGNVTVS